MRIGLDGQPLIKPKTGVGHYTFELARALAALRPDVSFELIAPDSFPPDIIRETEAIPNLRTVAVKTNALTRRWWSIGLPRYLRREKFDLFHGLNYEVPLFNSARNVVTVHDLSVFTHAQTHDPRIARRARKRLPIMLRAAKRIFTPTQAIKNEVVTRFNIDSARITVTPEAPRENFFRMEFEQTLPARQRYGIENDFILSVGTIEPRKNLQTLLRAFTKILSETKLQPQLAIAGGEGWLTSELRRFMAGSDFGDRLRMIGYLADDDLRALYSSCRLFVYPSLYEGFGLPPLEAMACGAPVIASRIAAHEEVLNDHARLVSPLDEGALKNAIVEMLEDDPARAQLAQSGFEHAAKFSWRKTAELTWEVYEEVCADGSHSHLAAARRSAQ
jgi:glycosyltransferase involved in cell wall biosynthesis